LEEAKECEPCENSKYSFPGDTECKNKNPCASIDYYHVDGECKDGKKQIVYAWIQPQVKISCIYIYVYIYINSNKLYLFRFVTRKEVFPYLHQRPLIVGVRLDIIIALLAFVFRLIEINLISYL
jgi:hypothetical protein